MVVGDVSSTVVDGLSSMVVDVTASVVEGPAATEVEVLSTVEDVESTVVVEEAPASTRTFTLMRTWPLSISASNSTVPSIARKSTSTSRPAARFTVYSQPSAGLTDTTSRPAATFRRVTVPASAAGATSSFSTVTVVLVSAARGSPAQATPVTARTTVSAAAVVQILRSM